MDKETVKYWYESIRFTNVYGCGILISMWCRAGRELIEIETIGL